LSPPKAPERSVGGKGGDLTSSLLGKSPSGGRGYESPKPATYVGAIEEGDIQVDYIQLHIFELFDGLQVILEAPSLNRSLGKLLY